MERDLRKLVYDIRSFGKGDLGNAHDLVHKLLDEELQSIQNKMQTLDSRLERQVPYPTYDLTRLHC